MTVRAVPLFAEHGVVLNNERWTEVDFEKLSPDDRRALVATHRRIVMVHEHDEKAFADLVASLEFETPPAEKRPAKK